MTPRRAHSEGGVREERAGAHREEPEGHQEVRLVELHRALREGVLDGPRKAERARSTKYFLGTHCKIRSEGKQR